MYYWEPQKKTIQGIDLPVNKLEFLTFYSSRMAGTSSYERILMINQYLIVHLRFWSYFIWQENMISYSENLQTKDHILNSSGYQKKSYTYVDAYVYLRL